MTEFLKEKALGFYFTVASGLLSLIIAIVYISAYNGTKYYDAAVFVLLLIAFVCFIGLSVFKVTAPFAPAIGGIFVLISLALYILATYIYLSEVFYNGIDAGSLAEVNPAYVFCLFGLVINIGVFVAGIFLKQLKKVQEVKGE